jgi:peptidoglycan/xylan/chitin deacetylase (PgdA/CDA1 family)
VHRVVLTFDDGPNIEHTPFILDALAKYNVPGLFFVIGDRLNVPGALEIVRRASNEGHLIGNHTFNHPNLTEVSPEEIRSQILRTHDLISEFEPKRKLFRPPYGACNDTVQAIAKELGYETVFWSASSKDWLPENESSAWVDSAVEQISLQHIAVVLCHDLKHTAEHLPRLIERVRRLSNYKFVDYHRRRDFQWLVDGIGRRARKQLMRMETRATSER